MGSSTSKSMDTLSVEEIAAAVSSLGAVYKTYGEAIRKSTLSGSKLLQMDDGELLKQMDSLGITIRLHRRKLQGVVKKAKSGSLADTTDSCSVTSATTQSSSSFHSNTYSSNHNSSSFNGSSQKGFELASSPENCKAMVDFESMLVQQSAEGLALLVNLENQKRALRRDSSKKEAKPTGPPEDQACIVLTDVQGSTVLWEANPQAMRAALALHDNILRKLREEHSGYEIDTEGDAFFLAFHTAKDALKFALALQKALREAEWADDILALKDACHDIEKNLRGLRVRMGIHMGSVTARKNAVTQRTEYTGETMETAHRVERMARGGQIMTTRETIESANLPQSTAQTIAQKTLSKDLQLDVVEVLPVIKARQR